MGTFGSRIGENELVEESSSPSKKPGALPRRQTKAAKFLYDCEELRHPMGRKYGAPRFFRGYMRYNTISQANLTPRWGGRDTKIERLYQGASPVQRDRGEAWFRN